ncbi:YraN family protein [Paenibacillus lutrae]|uniref:UPF0102 protein EDM21_06495 n=1 Tax=Paenibacillus lutrae TaxID=2078573 RepID=A0A7X3FGZ2_9BACL|nr:YraN family protein [Paenibacillus lutrae]MVO99176.1 YraN family protein [Paenibacillus lutrae]
MAGVPSTRQSLGKYGENKAEEHLQGLGYRILARNWRCRYGELDLIAEHEDVVVFIEVRTRRLTGRFGYAKESVDGRKQTKVRQISQMYLHSVKQQERKLRFDVITVEMSALSEFVKLEHLCGAF